MVLFVSPTAVKDFVYFLKIFSCLANPNIYGLGLNFQAVVDTIRTFYNNHPSLVLHGVEGKERTLYTMLSLKINFSCLQISESTKGSYVLILCVYS